MKELRIKNWESVTKDMDGEGYEIQYGVDKVMAYTLSIHSTRSNTYYQMSIDKEVRPDYSYQLWIYNMNSNISYPMTIGLGELNSKERFVKFLEGVIGTADKGVFSGNSGNHTTQ